MKINITQKKLKVFNTFIFYFLFNINLISFIINKIIKINNKLIN